jgi:cell division protease FtsH
VNYSEDIAQAIDDEVKRIVSRAHDRAREVVQSNIDKLHAVAKRLMEIETLDRAEFEALVA